jgi:hypothetical protein
VAVAEVMHKVMKLRSNVFGEEHQQGQKVTPNEIGRKLKAI